MGCTDSAITTDLEVDDPLVQNADFEFDKGDRQYLDNQIRGVQQHLVNALIRGRHATYVRVAGSSATIPTGRVACLATAASVEPQVTLAVGDDLSTAKAGFGVVVFAAAPGSFALIATGGILPPTLTKLATSDNGFARVNTSTGAVECVESLTGADFGLGLVVAGFLHLVPGIGLGGGGDAGGGGEPLPLEMTFFAGAAQIPTSAPLIVSVRDLDVYNYTDQTPTSALLTLFVQGSGSHVVTAELVGMNGAGATSQVICTSTASLGSESFVPNTTGTNVDLTDFDATINGSPFALRIQKTGGSDTDGVRLLHARVIFLFG